jgi:OOP family OmpA-OmpF porin
MSASRDGKLAAALQPLTESAIRSSVRKNRQVFVDVLFPVMGPAIRKAIASTIQGLIQNFNQILEYGFSVKGWRWRLEALRTQRPFVEVVLLHTLVYQVEQVFLIHRASGLLIDHVVAKTAVAQNPDLVSGMLTAIKDFVQDSFGATQDDTLDNFQVGGRKVWIEHGAYAIVALVISGNPSIRMREMMRDVLDDVHVTAFEALKQFSGDTTPFKEIRPTLNSLLQIQFKSKEDKRFYGAWIVLGIIFLLIGWGLFHWITQQQRWSQFADRLNSQPGIVVTQIKKQDGKHHLYGLRDPFAPESAQLLEGSHISPKSIIFHWEPYHSAYPEYAQLRIKKLFKPPASVQMVFEAGSLAASGSALRNWIDDTRRMVRIVPWINFYDDGDVIDIDAHLKTPATVTLTQRGKTLSASGRATRQWVADTRLALKSLPGISGFDEEQLTDADQQAWESLTRVVDSSVFYFESGSDTLMQGQQGKLQVFIHAVKRLVALSHVLDRSIQIDIIGHADQTGDEAYNMVISRRRAKTFADLLAAADIEKSVFIVHAAGSQDPIQPGTDLTKRAFNRRVIFSVESAALKPQ